MDNETIEVDMAQLALEVLLVEDDAVNRTLVRVLLRHAGCSVTAAENGAAALDACRERRFDAVLMDCYMPVMDGFEATTAIRGLGGWSATLPIIALTASVTTADRDQAAAVGMSDFLLKPIDRRRLASILATIRDRKEAALRRQAG